MQALRDHIEESFDEFWKEMLVKQAPNGIEDTIPYVIQKGTVPFRIIPKQRVGRGWSETEQFRFGPPKKEGWVKGWSERKLVSFWTSRQTPAGRVVGNGTNSVSDHLENRSTISKTTIKQYDPIQAYWTHKKPELRSYSYFASFHWEHACQRFALVAIIGIEPHFPGRLQGCANKRAFWVSEKGTCSVFGHPKKRSKSLR